MRVRDIGLAGTRVSSIGLGDRAVRMRYGCDTVLSTGPLFRCWSWGDVTAVGAARYRCGMERGRDMGFVTQIGEP